MPIWRTIYDNILKFLIICVDSKKTALNMRPKPRIEDKFKVVILAKTLHVNTNIL